jgi:DNA-binding CsgD family transcriptional regulator
METSELKQYIVGELPAGVMVFNRPMDVVYINRRAQLFQERFDLPSEIPSVCSRIFDAVDAGQFKEKFPGEIYLSKRFDGSLSKWTFKLSVCEQPQPLVSVFIMEDPIWSRLDLSEVRIRTRLTRRETDVMRRVLEGLQNGEIAEDLQITEQTVKDHLSNIYTKLNVTNRFSLLRFLVETSLPG